MNPEQPSERRVDEHDATYEQVQHTGTRPGRTPRHGNSRDVAQSAGPDPHPPTSDHTGGDHGSSQPGESQAAENQAGSRDPGGERRWSP